MKVNLFGYFTSQSSNQLVITSHGISSKLLVSDSSLTVGYCNTSCWLFHQSSLTVGYFISHHKLCGCFIKLYKFIGYINTSCWLFHHTTCLLVSSSQPQWLFHQTTCWIFHHTIFWLFSLLI